MKNARVGVCVVNHVKGNEGALISTLDWQEVREDGTFDFASLPPGSIHVVVLAEGWMHTCESNTWNIVRPLPLTMPMPEEVVIPMTRTASCEVLVLGKDAQPLPGVIVAASPNLNWDGRGNGLLDIHGPRLGQILSAPLKATSDWEAFLKTWRTYEVVTDSEGRATITNLPSASQHLYALPRSWNLKENFTPLAEGRSEEIAWGMTGKVVLRVQK